MSSPSPHFDRYMERALERQATWTRWFAWYPARIDGKRVWFKLVERRVPSCYDCYLCGWRPIDEPKFEYRWPTDEGSRLDGPVRHSAYCEHREEWRKSQIES